MLVGVGLAIGGSRPSPTSDAGHPTATPRTDAGPGLVFCQTPQPRSLRAVLDRVVPGSSDAQVEPLGVARHGKIFVAAWTPGFSGVGELRLATGSLRRIRAFADPDADQADGVSDGRWLVWAQTYSLRDFDRFTMYAWDAAAGRLRRIGHSIDGPHGDPWPSPWHAPAISGHYAAWAQGYGPGGLVEIRLADLRTGHVTTIRQGHVQPPLFDGGLVVWPESDRPNTLTTLRAYSLDRRRLVPLPVALRAVRGTEYVVSDGTRTAYLSPDMARLYYSKREDQPAGQALALPPGVHFSSLALAPGSLAWTTTRATYLASTETGAFTRVTPRYGYATGSGSVILVSDAPSGKQVHPALPLHVVDPAAIRWPNDSPVRPRRQAGPHRAGQRCRGTPGLLR